MGLYIPNTDTQIKTEIIMIQPYKENPILLDRALQTMRKSLLAKLPWLKEAFGKAYKLYDSESISAKYNYPAAYVGKGEYLSLMPNDKIGNFSWFDIYSPQTVNCLSIQAPMFISEGSLIVWYDMESIFEDNLDIYSEEIKSELLAVIKSPDFLPNGCRIELGKIYETPETIYKGYAAERSISVQPIDKQFLVYPYFGIRIEFTLKINTQCKL